MGYTYEFNERSVGNWRLVRGTYETIQQGLRLFRDELEAWNRRALEHGAVASPYASEVADLNAMIEWADEKLSDPKLQDVVVQGISIGSLRYAKAALLFLKQTRQRDRAARAKDGWPDAALQSLDGGIDQIKKIAEVITYEPTDVLWEVIPKGGVIAPGAQMVEWDIFLSHASEDKEAFVRPLAKELASRGVKVWFDEFTLRMGDSLRRSIDRGLAHSRFGVVISPDFLRKEWPQKELDGLFAREVDGVTVILPIWHNIAADDIRRYSPTLADKLAATSSKGLDHVIDEILHAIRGGDAAGATRTHVAAARLPTADVRVALREGGRTERFVIENLGPAIARDVHLEVDASRGKGSPLVDGDHDEKLPIDILRPGAHVELIAALCDDTGTTVRVKWRWREEDGRIVERNEKVSLQST